MNRRKLGRLSITILRALGTGAVMFFILSSPHGTRRFLRGVKRELQKRKTYRSLDRLQARKLIDYRKNGDIVEITLTHAGRKIVSKYDGDKIVPRIPKKWDGVWRVILSDIPESKRKARDAFRQKFYEWGFYRLQKSVFVYPYSCENEIATIREIFHLPVGTLLMIETKHVGNEKALKKFFGLK